jgi:hypothetical protein
MAAFTISQRNGLELGRDFGYSGKVFFMGVVIDYQLLVTYRQSSLSIGTGPPGLLNTVFVKF